MQLHQDVADDDVYKSGRGSGVESRNEAVRWYTRWPVCEPKCKTVFEEYFDYEKWAWNVPWGLYNVLLVTFEDGAAHRLGIGKICAQAFDEASLERKRILLR